MTEYFIDLQPTQATLYDGQVLLSAAIKGYPSGEAVFVAVKNGDGEEVACWLDEEGVVDLMEKLADGLCRYRTARAKGDTT